MAEAITGQEVGGDGECGEGDGGMRGVGVEDLSSKQEAENGSSLERLANQQLARLSDRIRDYLTGYATATTTRLISDMADSLMTGAANYEDGAYLDAIEHACRGLDYKEKA